MNKQILNGPAICKRLLTFREESETRTEFFKRMTIGESTFRHWERNTRNPSKNKVEEIAHYLNCDDKWLKYGVGNRSDPWDLFGDKKRLRVVNVEDEISSEFSYIRRVNLKVAAGGGAFMEEEGIEKKYAFRTEWLKTIVGHTNNCALVMVTGDSMEPLLSSGDMVLLDLGFPSIKEGGIYAFEWEGCFFIKRLKPFGQEVLIWGDNPGYKMQTATLSDVRIMGRAVWAGKEL
jgi:phage repressor protein C with HTH and peptisase S24 domain